MSSQFTSAWAELYATQTEVVKDTAASDDGTRLATVGGVTGNAVIGEVGLDEELQLDGFAQSGEYRFQMLASYFDVAPVPQCAVMLPNVVAALVLKDAQFNNGIYHMTAIDPSAR